jgi:hypothetical protein
MKKLFVTYQVKDADWWLLNNKLEETVGHLGWRFEFFRKQNSNLVGYIVDIPNEDDLKDILLNSALVSTRLKEHGVLFETIEVLEAVTDRVKPEVTQLLKNFS